MPSPPPGFTGRLKRAVTGDAGTPLVFLGNFEVENQWALGEPALPRVAAHAGSAVVNRMDEFALLLGGKDDHVVLKTAVDDGYRAYLEGLGLALPTVHVVAGQEPRRTVSEDALADPDLLRTLTALAADGARLTAHGVSTVEEELAERTGLRLAAPPADRCKHVNSKVYSRRLADELGIRQARGWACETPKELAAAVAAAGDLLAAGHRVVVKDAFGVSGKGIVVVDNERTLARLHRMAAAQAERTARAAGTAVRTALVIEEWVAKRADLNYQFTVGRDGAVHFDFVKELLTEGGVHKGHRMPARLTGGQVAQIRDTAHRLGERLAADGYFGVVGVDAMVDPDDGLYPVVEINARNNMSTYQAVVHEVLAGPDDVAVARHFTVRPRRPLPFAELRELLGPTLLTRSGGRPHGLFVNNYATVNAAAADAGENGFEGRLYGVLLASSDTETEALDTEITRRLAALTERS
ncbi:MULTISPECIES: preATP grasp domain-containing protein [Streptomyces]|uniref:ATP-grasp domain-containing protein n=1 Tax=Streptomyces argyrophylli TaxID=2726118 RepID=A0A6M4PNA4_9ACTN|nr:MULTISPECIES: ATP-grasp domain-containing protein [Streptomyces]QJS10400.1 ATP-grasp domain-containing protein [Streptomyces argyrophyllae]